MLCGNGDDSVTAVINSDAGKLSLGPLDNEYLEDCYQTSGIEISTKTYLYTDGVELANFFKSMASDWKGWTGIKTWASIESDFELEATNNGTNSVDLVFNLRKNLGADDDWALKGRTKIELDVLDKIAGEIERLYQNP